MIYMFLDESGDLGFNFNRSGTSVYFLITVVMTNNKDNLEKMVKKIIKGFSNKDLKKHSGVLHAHKESPKTRKRLLGLLQNDNSLKIGFIYINKKKIQKVFKFKKHIFYNRMVEKLLSYVFLVNALNTGADVNLIVSKRETNKLLNTNFNLYIQNKIKGNDKFNLKIDIKNTSAEKGLQIADMVSWAIFRNYEYGDDLYSNLIKNKIVCKLLFIE